MIKYIYILNLKIRYNEFGDFYHICDIHNKIYYDYNIARSIGLDYIKESIKRHKKWTTNKSIDELLKDADIDFTITKVSCNYLDSKYDKILEDYYLKNKSSIKKKDLYDFIMTITGEEFIRLDYNGYPGFKIMSNIDESCCSKSFEYGKKYHLEKFNIGDKVKVKVPFEGHGPDKVYEIAEIINKDNSIYSSEDPLHFRQGYLLTDIYNDYCNKYSQLHFDEDLILSSNEEWYDFYKSWDWYDDIDVVGTYGDFINGRINKG